MERPSGVQRGEAIVMYGDRSGTISFRFDPSAFETMSPASIPAYQSELRPTHAIVDPSGE